MSPENKNESLIQELLNSFSNYETRKGVGVVITSFVSAASITEFAMRDVKGAAAFSLAATVFIAGLAWDRARERKR